jgi:para-aminobenzoate synthetase/4-amino-4-deoxychorismate lyase
MDRLLDSAAYFGFPVSKVRIEENLDQLTRTFDQPNRVRLLLDHEGNVEVTGAPFSFEMKPVRVALAQGPVNSNDLFLFHKTTRREVYDLARAAHPNCDDVLLHNERGELTEFSIGNLVVELDGELVTPPVACGLLAGTFRVELLETGKVMERIIHLHRLKECAKVYRVNSVRKWQEVILL